jgi:predicted nuclease of predicted toxin-antitoxin system
VWVLDVNVPVQLAAVLRERGIESETAQQRDWSTLTNGALVHAAVRSGFTCVLTRDTQFAHAAAQALREYPGLAIVLIVLPQLKWPAFAAAFESAWGRSPINAVAGAIRRWPE